MSGENLVALAKFKKSHFLLRWSLLGIFNRPGKHSTNNSGKIGHERASEINIPWNIEIKTSTRYVNVISSWPAGKKVDLQAGMNHQPSDPNDVMDLP